MKKLSIAHVITGLEIGGAESMLYRLLSIQRVCNIDLCVISLTGLGPIGERIQSLGIPVWTLGANPGVLPSLTKFVRLVTIVRRYRPDIIQGWMYHGNLAATFTRLFIFRRVAVYWNIRQTLNLLSDERPLTRKVIRLSAVVSRFPTGIIYNSTTAVDQHAEIGFSSKKHHFIPNGFQVDEPKSMALTLKECRAKMNLSDENLVVGHIARFHPKKDHKTFFEAARAVVNIRQDVIFVAVGRGLEEKNESLWDIIETLGLQTHVQLLGEQGDIAGILPALDLLVSSSAWGEGFPNVIGEAMAVGIPCVGTDVGETARIIGETGIVVSPKNPPALASAIIQYLSLNERQRYEMGQKARTRVEELFDLRKVSEEYLSIYQHRKLNEAGL